MFARGGVDQVLRNTARLAAINTMGLLGEDHHQEALDRITRIAVSGLRCDVAVLSVVTDECELPRSVCAARLHTGSRQSLPLQPSLAAKAVIAGGCATGHHLDAADRELVEATYGPVAAWASVPLVTGGLAIGALTAIQQQPRMWSGADLALLKDLAALAVTELELWRKQTDIRAFAETLSTAILIVENGHIRYVNSAALTMTGYRREQLLDRSVLDIAAAESRAVLQRRLAARRAGEPLASHFELKVRTNFGREHWADISVSEITFEGRSAVIAAAIDVTARKHAEARLRALIGRLEAVREEERTRIAREMHDELGQALTALKIDLSALSDRVERGVADDRLAMIEKTRSMIRVVDQTVETVRTLATELRPGVLDHVGLRAAINWQLEDFQKRTGIKCRFTAVLTEYEPDARTSTALFRICQEALTNVARHARATAVTVRMKRTVRSLMFVIQDNGIGMAADRDTHSSFGLQGMHERVFALGGRLRVTSRAARGTRIAVRTPLAMAVPLPMEGKR